MVDSYKPLRVKNSSGHQWETPESDRFPFLQLLGIEKYL